MRGDNKLVPISFRLRRGGFFHLCIDRSDIEFRCILTNLVSSSSHATDQFTVYTTLELASGWDLVVTGNLFNPLGKDCNKIPVQSFKIERMGRFVKMNMDTWHVTGPGIQYAKVDFQNPLCGKSDIPS